MPFYRVTEDAVTIRLSLKNPEKKFYPKWAVVGQSDQEVAIHSVMGMNAIGLYLGDRVAYRLGSYTDKRLLSWEQSESFPCVELLVGDMKQIIPTEFVTLLSQEEIDEMIDS